MYDAIPDGSSILMHRYMYAYCMFCITFCTTRIGQFPARRLFNVLQ